MQIIKILLISLLLWYPSYSQAKDADSKVTQENFQDWQLICYEMKESREAQEKTDERQKGQACTAHEPLNGATHETTQGAAGHVRKDALSQFQTMGL